MSRISSSFGAGDIDMHEGPPNRTSIPDLSPLSSKDITKLPEHAYRRIENGGRIYSDILRELQIAPAYYSDFLNLCILPIRRKHWVEIRRCSEASLRHMSDLMLRGYGYVVWKENSPWLVTDLEPGEERLVHIKMAAREENARYGVLSHINFHVSDSY